MYFAGVIPDPKVISEADIAQELADMLELVKNAIHDAPERMKYAMNNFIYTVGVFYLPLYDKAVEIVKGVGPVEVRAARLQTKTCKVLVNNYLMINKFYNGQRRLAVKHLG